MADTLADMGKAVGVDSGDVATLVRHGLNESTAIKAKEFGVSLKDIFNLMMQFGPQVIPILITIMLSLKSPKPKEPSVKKAPRHETPEHEVQEDR